MDNLTYNDKDLARDWQQMIENKFNHSRIEKDNIMEAITRESKSNISELKKRIKYKLYWGVFFIIIFGIALLFSLHNSDMAILIGIIEAAYIIGFVAMFMKYKHIKESGVEGISLLQSLKTNMNAIKSVLQYEKIWAVIVFAPIIFIAILGGKVFSGFSIMESLNDSTTLLIAVIAISIISPAMIWVSNKMNNFAYGGLLKKMEENIVKMETLS